MKPIKTLVLVADGGKARMLVNEGVGHGLHQISEISVDDFPDSETRYADTPGRSQGQTGGSHVMDRSTSEQDQERETFARHIVDASNALWAKDSYDRFAMIAPPGMLGVLRGLIDGELADKMAFDLPKDLVKIPTADLSKHLEDQIAF